jgi:hypothetical protein
VEHWLVVLDVSREDFIRRLSPATADLDIGLVVSNAGTGNPGEFLKLDRQLHQATVRVSTMAHLDITHHFGAKLAKQRRGGLVLAGAMGAENGVPVWRMTEPRRRMYTVLARRFTTLVNPCCTKRCADPPSKRKQANDIAFPPSLGGRRVSGHTAPTYAIPLFWARIAVNL